MAAGSSRRTPVSARGHRGSEGKGAGEREAMGKGDETSVRRGECCNRERERRRREYGAEGGGLAPQRGEESREDVPLLSPQGKELLRMGEAEKTERRARRWGARVHRAGEERLAYRSVCFEHDLKMQYLGSTPALETGSNLPLLKGRLPVQKEARQLSGAYQVSCLQAHEAARRY